MAQQPLNIGTGVESGDGDPLRVIFAKISNNFADLDGRLTSNTALVGTLGSAAFLNVGTVTGTVADGGALTAEATRATAAEQANTTLITAETSRAQSAEALKAPIASPSFTGVPTAPTAAAGTGTTQIATTAFVATAVAAGGGGGGGGGGVPLTRQIATSGLATGGGDLTADRVITVTAAAQSDVAAGTDTTKALTSFSVAARFGSLAPLASPALVGTPTAPTAAAGTNTTQIANMAALSAAIAAIPAPAVVPSGQAQLVYSSASALLLKPFKGNQIWVNGAYRTVPASGVSLANTGLTTATLYYVYAFLSGSTLTLEAVATAHATDATYGHEIKSGDGTRTLVGMAYMGVGAPGTFVDTAQQRLVRSWFNDPGIACQKTLSSSQSTSSSSFSELNGSTDRIGFLAWGNEAFALSLTASLRSNAANGTGVAQIAVDGVNVGPLGSAQAYANGAQFGVGANYAARLAEGYHYQSMMVRGDGTNSASFAAGDVGHSCISSRGGP